MRQRCGGRTAARSPAAHLLKLFTPILQITLELDTGLQLGQSVVTSYNAVSGVIMQQNLP